MFNKQEIDIQYKDDVLHILKKNKGKVSYREEGKYGIEFGFTIEGEVICCSIPEASYLFGFSKDTLKNFSL